MTVLSQRFGGLLRICNNCNALLNYDVKDIYEKEYIYCICCKAKLAVPLIVEDK